MQEDNESIPVPIIFTAPADFKDYFAAVDRFIKSTLGEQATHHYQIVIDNASMVAQLTLRNLNRVTAQRRRTNESYAFNWGLSIPENMQIPFHVNHENMAELRLFSELPSPELVSELRKVFSGIVAGNVKPYGIRQVNQHGPYQLSGDADLMGAIDTLLAECVANQRMKISAEGYQRVMSS